MLQVVAENVSEGKLVDENLLDRVLHESLGHGTLVDEAPNRRLAFLVFDQIADLMQVARVAGVNGAKKNPRAELLVVSAVAQDLASDLDAGNLGHDEIEVEDDVFYFFLRGLGYRLIRRLRAVNLRLRPALQDPRAHLLDRIRRVVRDQHP